MARVPLLNLTEMDPQLQETFRKMEGNGFELLNINRVMAHAPELCLGFMRFGNRVLFRAKLDPKLRELAILRVARLTKAGYERQQHEVIARKLGVPGGQIRGVAAWRRSRVFNDHERAVLEFTDELTGNVRARKSTFAKLKGFLSQQELVELTLTIGFYGMVARFLEGLEVDLEKKRLFKQG